jgi:hypothetical protein
MAARKSRTADGEKTEHKRTLRETEALNKVSSAPAVPRLKVLESVVMGPDHPDDMAGIALQMEAVATTDNDFFQGFVSQLAEAGGSEIDEQRLNFMLSVVKGIKPRDQIEAMLAAQMAAVHTATMKFSGSLVAAEYLDHRDSAERTFNKLTRTFVTQMEALKRYRTGGEQTVTVQHVNVSEGGQAIVGNVTQGQRNEVPNGVPPQPLALTHDKTQPMPIIESKREVPVPAQRHTKKK